MSSTTHTHPLKISSTKCHDQHVTPTTLESRHVRVVTELRNFTTLHTIFAQRQLTSPPILHNILTLVKMNTPFYRDRQSTHCHNLTPTKVPSTPHNSHSGLRVTLNISLFRNISHPKPHPHNPPIAHSPLKACFTFSVRMGPTPPRLPTQPLRSF